MYERALDIGEQCWKSNHPTISQAYGNIGDACRCLKDYTRALHSCEKAIDVAKKCLPITDSDLAEAYTNLAGVYSDINDHSTAIASYLRALDIYTMNPPLNSFLLGLLYENIGVEHIRVEQYETALSHLQKSLNIFQTSQEDASSLTRLYFHLGYVYQKTGDYDNAPFYVKKCLHYELATVTSISYRSLSQTYDTLGDIYRQSKDYPMALISYENARANILKDDQISSAESGQSDLLQQYQDSIDLVKTLLK